MGHSGVSAWAASGHSTWPGSHIHSHSLQQGLWVGTPLEAHREEGSEEGRGKGEKEPRSGSILSLVPAVHEGHPFPCSFFSLVI